jgi:predicted dehydrogenase
VFDDSGARADAVAKDFGISHVAPDWVDVVRDPEIQLVDIAVCDGRQADIARAAFAHGKHVLIERSAASSPTEREALARTANAAGLHAAVCFPYLYNPVQTLARKLIADGELGTITGFRATFDRGSAADAVVQSSADMRDRGIGAQAGQIIALALQLVGPIERVCGMSKAFAGARADARLERTNTREDFVQFLCEFESGAAAHFSSTAVGEEQWLGLSYEVQGALGGSVRKYAHRSRRSASLILVNEG